MAAFPFFFLHISTERIIITDLASVLQRHLIIFTCRISVVPFDHMLDIKVLEKPKVAFAMLYTFYEYQTWADLYLLTPGKGLLQNGWLSQDSPSRKKNLRNWLTDFLMFLDSCCINYHTSCSCSRYLRPRS